MSSKDHRDDAPRGAALPAAAGVRRAGERAAGHLRPRSGRVLGDGGRASASPGSSRSRQLLRVGAARTRSGTSAASSTSPTTASTATSRRATATRSPTTGRASPRTTGASSRSPTCSARRRSSRTRSRRSASKKGTPVGIYMGMVPETPIAMLACARIGAPHTVVFGGFSADSLSGRLHDMELRGADHAGRGLAARHDRAAEEDGRRGARRLTDGAERRRPAPHRRRRADAGRARPLVARGRDRRERVPVRADGRRGPALPALHVRHDREAEGDRAHDGRLPRRRRDDAPLHLRHQARLRVLVRRRRRLGHRAQLHRLRPALQRDDRRHVRGHARLPRQGPLVGRSSSATRSTSSTPRRPRSART